MLTSFISLFTSAQTNLVWDPGTTQQGSTVFSGSNTNAGLFLFKITATNTAASLGYWRSVLAVTEGEADLYISTSMAITTNSYTEKSDTPGGDRIVRSLSPGQNWYLLVAAESNSTWTVFAGDLHVTELDWDLGTTQNGTEVYTNPGIEEGSYLFRLTTTNTAASLGYWRTVLNTTGGNADLYTDPLANVTPDDYQYIAAEAGSDTLVQSLSAGQTRYILVEAEAGASWSLFAGDIHLTELTWDPGTAAAGTEVFNNLNLEGGAYYFKLTTELADLAAWRTALDVLGGEAEIYLKQNSLPYLNSQSQSFTDSSTYPGDDGFTRYLSNISGAGQEWYFLVQAATGSTWNLLSGDVYAEDLGALAPNSASGSGPALIPPEGIQYYKTTLPANALAWRLWLQEGTGATTLNQPFYVRQGLAPYPSSSAYYDRVRTGQGLLVPDYLIPGSPIFYYVGIPGVPGTAFQFDSRQQEIIESDFNTTEAGQASTGFRFKTYHISVPSSQIAWEVTATPAASTNPDLAVRKGKVPNAFNNDAFSESPFTTASDSITLVPTALTAGSYYVTIYGDAPIAFNLRNREPVVTQIDFSSVSTNDAPNRAGWRYYAVSNIGQQIGQLGWLLELFDQVPGTEIAIRRNFIPGRWSRRQNGSASIWTTSYNDQSSTFGFLQAPSHPSDVWYVGIYTPAASLGEFVLASGTHVPIEFSMDGTTNAALVLEPKRWHFYHVDIPTQTNGNSVLGWELRMTDWSGERPYMSIRRDQLPDRTGTTSSWFPYSLTQWASGKQWSNRNSDWSGYSIDPSGQTFPQPLLSMAMGAPLEPGSYYISFFNNSSTTTGSYSFVSRAIGPGMAYEPQILAFNGGSVAVTDFPARDIRYFKVTVPTNTPSWKLKLENTVGETRLYIREARVPTWSMGGNASTSPGFSFPSLTKLQKTGDEYFVLLPENGADFVPAGDYFLMVVSEGQNPSGNTIGTGLSSAILHSLGIASPVNLGGVPLAGEISQARSYNAGEVDLLNFDVPANMLSLQVRLESTTGSPRMYLRTDGNFPRGMAYGLYAGRNAEYNDTQIITLANPTAGTYALSVGHNGSTPAAGTYTVRIVAQEASEIVFDGYTNAPVVLPPREWHYYHLDVPAQTNGQTVIGWDLRLLDWSGQRPYMMIRRDLAPIYPAPQWSYPRTASTWPSGSEWVTTGNEWSKRPYDTTGKLYPQYMLSMAMGAPLEPGNYQIGFYNPSTTLTSSYHFASSGIGTGMAYDPQPLAFNGGTAAITNLPPRGVAYYRVEVPTNAISWKVRLENTLGETRLYLREARVPTWSMGGSAISSPGLSFGTMTQLQKEGDEYFVLLPENGQTTLPGGPYYLMVVGEGENPSGNSTGPNASSAVLHSDGEAPVNQLGTLPGAGTVTDTNSYASGEVQLYQFEVPIGVLSIELRLSETVGSPEMNVRVDENQPNGASYGSYSGHSKTFVGASVITIPNPAPGTYSLLVNDLRSATVLTAGSYILDVVTAGTTDIAIDGGGALGVELPPKSWEYFKVEVPTQLNGMDVLGWEIRVTNWTGARPHMVMRRDELPSGVATTWNSPRSTSNWLSGWQWATSGADWTGYFYDPSGTQVYPQYLLSMGMGAPLEPGTYYVGFYNNSASVTSSVDFVSRAIGNGMAYDPQPIAFNGGSAVIANLAAHGVAYFEVNVPANTSSWKIKLENTSGETALYIREGRVPTWTVSTRASYSPGAGFSQMTKLQKSDNEHFVLFPENGETVLPAGVYYLMVVSEGQVPTSNRIGTGTASAILHSQGEALISQAGTLLAGGSLVTSNSYEAGEVNLYHFEVQPNVAAVEIQLANVVGDPEMYLRRDLNMPNDIAYGLYSGYADQDLDRALITVANPDPGIWSMAIGDRNLSGQANGSYTISITDIAPSNLNFDDALNTNGNTAVANGLLANDQRAFYRVEVPAQLDGEPVVGWYLKASVTQGNAQIRVRKDLLPQDNNSAFQTPFASIAQVVVPPLLEPGTWYVEVKGVGATSYTLTSSAVALERSWTMPALGEAITTPGLSVPLFGDSGVNTAGLPLPIDQGVDLDQGFFHFYSVEIPINNAGLLRTQLEAISGNPNLYIRVGDAPTLNHDADGAGSIYDRSLTSTANTEYGNWVPLDGRSAAALEAGTWYLMVKADGASNTRYRLKLSGGNAYAGGNVQDLPLEGGSFSGQLLADNDWRHYRVVVPTHAPVNWEITYAQASGNVDLYIRDTVPAGNWSTFSDNNGAIRDWNDDQKNRGTPRVNFPDTGTHTLNVPPLRPGHTYYLSFVAKVDASFSVSSAMSGGAIPLYEKVDFVGGLVTTNIPAGSSITYQVDVPSDAVRWIHSTTNSSALNVYLEQGSMPSQTASDHWQRTFGSGNLNRFLRNTSGFNWPWRAGYSYFFTVVNPGATPEPFTLVMAGSLAPEIPQNLSATDGTVPTGIQLNWSSISGAGSYEVWRSVTNLASQATHLASPNFNNHLDLSATPGQSYYYWVSVAGATNSAEFSAADVGWRSAVNGSLSPSQRIHTAAGGTGNIATLVPAGSLWSAAENLNWVAISSGSPGIGNGTVVYSVSEYAGTLARTGSVVVAGQTFAVIQEALALPENIQATDGGYEDRTVITWQPVAEATRYYIYRNTINDAGSAAYQAWVTTNFFNDISGVVEQVYSYWVRPYNGGGTGGYSLPDTGFRGSGLVPPDWQNDYFPGGYPGNPIDSDGDGFSNLEEFIADTVPTNGLSYFQIESINPTPAGFVLHWNSVSGRVYAVNWVGVLTNSVMPLTSGISYPQGSFTDTVHIAEDQGFFNLEVEME